MGNLMGALDKIKNFLPIIGTPSKAATYGIRDGGGSKNKNRNLGNIIFPSSLERTRQDLADWKDAIVEMEAAWLPYRVKVQKLYETVVLNEHLSACMERRKDLTLLREFQIENANGERDKTWTEYFQKNWFSKNMLNYILDAQAYGYNLISIGDINDSIPVNPTIIQRRFISPDRHMVSPFEYNPSGVDFRESQFAKWHIWIPTLSSNGISSCGYGNLYNVAKTEIYLRNNVAFNMSFIQMFAQPYRMLKTAKTEGAERDEAEKAMQAMGDAGYIILDMMDELEFLNDGAAGNGYKSYNDFEHRLESKISKFWLGHADAIDSVPGKLGSNTLPVAGGKTDNTSANTPVAKALRDKQSKDGGFVEPIVNESVIPKLQALGIGIPDGCRFKFLNDAEEREVQELEAHKNQLLATLALTMAQGGLKMSAEYFRKITGVDCSEVEIMPDKNVIKDPKDQAEGKPALKDESKKRTNSPKKTK
jgi:hypothetical protein